MAKIHVSRLSDNAGVDTDLALTEVANGVFELRLPIPFEDGLVNVFLFMDGEEADLLDCGMNAQDSLDAIRQALDHLGARRLRRLLVTHIHPDHYGAAGVLAGQGRADLYIHRLEVPLVHPRYVELEQLVEQVRAYLLVNGVPDDEADALSNSQRALSQEWTPGHSPGHVCLFEPAGGLLFAGDHILPDLSPNIGLHPQSTPDPLHDYLAGLQRMAGLQPRQVLPAHGRPFTEIATRVDGLTSHHKRRLDQIVEILGEGQKTGWRVALDLWGSRENLYEKRLALQEGLAHLQALAVEGRVSKSVTPDSVRWQRI